MNFFFPNKSYFDDGRRQNMTYILVLLAFLSTAAAHQPHIIVMFADDLGYHNIGFRHVAKALFCIESRM